MRIIIRETYQDPANYGKVSFPTAAKVSDLRPYTKGTLIREEMELEEELELDEEDDEIEDIGRVVPDDVTDGRGIRRGRSKSTTTVTTPRSSSSPPLLTARRRPSRAEDRRFFVSVPLSHI